MDMFTSELIDMIIGELDSTHTLEGDLTASNNLEGDLTDSSVGLSGELIAPQEIVLEGTLASASDELRGSLSGGSSEFVESDPIFSASPAHGITSSDITRWNNTVVPTNVSAFTNDAGYITEESDPTVPNWAKAPSKPTYTAAEVGALPDSTQIPSKTSDLENDSGFITGYTETDPTVPSWAKAPSKPTYTANEVGALPDDTFIPTKVSDLENDSGYITGYTETDPTVPSWAKAPSKPAYTANEVGALPDNTFIPTKVSDLTNDAGYITGYTETDPTVPSWAKQVTKPTYTASEVGAMPLIDLGSFDIEEYDWDLWEYLADKTETGFYTVYEEQDGFYYFFRVECTEAHCYQEVWATEEGSLMRSCRQGWSDGEGGWEWNDFTNWMTADSIYSNFYTKGATYSKTEVDNKLANKVDNTTLNSYYTKTQVNNLLSNFVPENMISTTWANLVSLRDDGELISGAFYRITDYNFITSKLGIQSGSHQFDIVVLAISESMVSETAYAVRHAGDHYFEREVTEGGIEWLYTVYVDDYAENYGDEPVDHADDIHSGDVFCYADTDIHPDTGEEVPVLFKTDTNEYDFDDPDFNDMFYWCGTYDLDGDEYDMWGKYEDGVFMQQYALTPIVVEDGELVVSPIPETKSVPVNLNAWELKYCLDNDKDLFAWADTNGKGVIYYMKDEFGNEAPYDFKNVRYARRWVSAVNNSILNNLRNLYIGESDYYAITTTASVEYRYTFDDNSGNDASLFGDASYNSIDTWIVDGQKQLNNIVTGYAKNSHFRPNTHNVTIASSCLNLDMQGDCCLFYGANALIGTFRYCTMVNANNINAEGGLRTTISSGASTIKVNGNCYDMNWASNLTTSEFVGGAFGITFGNYCSNIKIGSNCNTITFGTYCVNITIGANCHTITFSNYWRYIEILDDCSRVTLSATGGSTTNYVQYITVRKAVTNVTLTPTRKLSYETIYYKTGKTETAV